MPHYQHIECHTVYSLGWGTMHINDYVAACKKSGQRYASICDTNFYGLINFIHACNAAKILPLISCRAVQGLFSVVLTAADMRGYRIICRILTDLEMMPQFSLKDELRALRDYSGLYIISSDEAVLDAAGAHGFAEINVQVPGYYESYRNAIARGYKPILLFPVFFRNRSDHELHRVLRATALRKKLSALLPQEAASPESFFARPEYILSRYAMMPEALYNTLVLSEKAQFKFKSGTLVFPMFGENSFELLRSRCIANIPKRYPSADERVCARLNKELDIIHKKGFSDYFLVVEDIVAHAGYYTCGRGSGAASITAYLLFITHVDPIEHDLFFERFLSEARTDPPDIDIDFAWDEKEHVTQYVFDRWPDRCGAVSNHITYSYRSCFHEAAKLYGIPEKQIMRVSKTISHYYDKAKDDYIYFSEDRASEEKWKKVALIASKLKGIPRFVGLHCGGVVITPEPVHNYVPLRKSAKGFSAIAWEKDQTEDFGLVKIDILGNRSIAVVRDAIAMVKSNTGREIKYKSFNPIYDSEVITAFAEGNTIGVFYVESPAMRQLQKKSRKGDYAHLVIHSSIIRPAANDYINDYLRRLRGEKWDPLLPEMGEILKETYGIMVYQEDISRIALEIGGFSMGEADEFRKVIGNPKKKLRREELKMKLVQAMKVKGIHPEIIGKLWHMMESFSGYSFCKPHSASYALLSFKACYMKVHHPAEFMAAVLSNRGGYYTTAAYISESRRMGLSILPPDINESIWPYTGNGSSIRIGLMEIRNLSRTTAERIISIRNSGGLFAGLADFMVRTETGVSETEILIRAGCFARIEKYNFRRLLFLAVKYNRIRQSHKLSDAASVFEMFRTIIPPELPDITSQEKSAMEINLFGYTVESHVMTQCIPRKHMSGVIRAADIPRYAGKPVCLRGVFITAKPVLTKKNELMKFVSFEDDTDIFECVFFPKIYQKFGKLLEENVFYQIHGFVQVEFDTPIINVHSIKIVHQ